MVSSIFWKELYRLCFKKDVKKSLLPNIDHCTWLLSCKRERKNLYVGRKKQKLGLLHLSMIRKFYLRFEGLINTSWYYKTMFQANLSDTVGKCKYIRWYCRMEKCNEKKYFRTNLWFFLKSVVALHAYPPHWINFSCRILHTSLQTKETASPRCSVVTFFLKTAQKLTGKNICQSLFLNKASGWSVTRNNISRSFHNIFTLSR